MMDHFQFLPWYPRGIRHFLGGGTSNYVALFNDDTVLKFPIVSPRDDGVYTARGQAYRAECRQIALDGLEVEEEILKRLGDHPRIIQLKGKHEDGLLLEYMPNGSVEHYLKDAPNTSPSQKLKWALQAAEGLLYTHERNVLHCDLSVGNLLLDSDLNVKLCDFTGRLLGQGGTVILDGGSRQNPISRMPGRDWDYCDRKGDMFGLGTVIYYMMTGCSPFPDLDPVVESDEVERRFKDCEFPPLEKHWGGDVIRKCWTGAYESAAELVRDLQGMQADEHSSGMNN
ncbi:kinase-like protein [Nemania abortiva]|nr:kinase-like protein [Nemania abortiva]